MLRIRGLAVVSAVAAALACLLAAGPVRARTLDHRVLTRRSIDGVATLATPAEVRRRIGAPVLTEHDGPGYDRSTVWRYRSGLVVTFQNGRVDELTTRDRADRLPDGVHVGMSARAARRRFHGRCADTLCATNRGATGEALAFALGRLASITIRVPAYEVLPRGRRHRIASSGAFDGARLGDSLAEVTRAWGRPSRTPSAGVDLVSFLSADLEGVFAHGRLVAFSNLSPQDRLPSGIHVDSSLAALKRAYGARLVPGEDGLVTVALGGPAPRTLTFGIDGGAVDLVSVALTQPPGSRSQVLGVHRRTPVMLRRT